jgi:hypothetical protein
MQTAPLAQCQNCAISYFDMIEDIIEYIIPWETHFLRNKLHRLALMMYLSRIRSTSCQSFSLKHDDTIYLRTDPYFLPDLLSMVTRQRG